MYLYYFAGLVRHCLLDEMGSRIRQSDDPGFRCQVFADLARGEFISLLWPVQVTPGSSEVRTAKLLRAYSPEKRQQQRRKCAKENKVFYKTKTRL